MKALIVGGTFNKQGGKTSGVIKQLQKETGWDFMNGGTLADLENIEFSDYDALLWMPNVSNDVPKLLPNIKKQNPTLLLISSKNTNNREFNEWDFIGRLLKSHSNLGIMVYSKPGESGFWFKLMDPLGNVYCHTNVISQLAEHLKKRVEDILSWSRLRSKCVGFAHTFELDEEFLEFVKYSAEQFTHFVNAANPNRFLGNASTRCMFGFPSERQRDRIFVTRRNIDKTLIDSANFVEVNDAEHRVEYYGEHKPSVDTPVQIKLFNYYPNIKFMMHGHVYVKEHNNDVLQKVVYSPFTEHVIPCGVVEEFEDIVKLYPDKDTKHFAVNLKGHGFITCADTVDNLKRYNNYVGRPFPELHSI